MKEIKTNGITILFVEVPEDGKDFYINNVGCIRYSVGGWSKCIEPEEMGVYLNKDEYEILGKSTELSEEQMKEIVDVDKEASYWDDEHEEYYVNYNINGKSDRYVFSSVQKSYLSLLEANGIVDRNPLGDIAPEYDVSKSDGGAYKFLDWKKAQSKVKHYLVLKRI